MGEGTTLCGNRCLYSAERLNRILTLIEFKYKVVNNGLIMPLASIKNIGGVISSYINKERLNGNFKVKL